MIDNNESDEMRLLKAFIKANGFDVKEEVNKYMFYHPSEVINGEVVSGAQPHVVFRTDYKVTSELHTSDMADAWVKASMDRGTFRR